MIENIEIMIKMKSLEHPNKEVKKRTATPAVSSMILFIHPQLYQDTKNRHKPPPHCNRHTHTWE
jgi:hypothetical protein